MGRPFSQFMAMSGGVPPALKLAEMFPKRVDRMVLLSAAPFTPFSPDVQDRPIPTWAYAALLGNDAVYWALTKVARGLLREAFDARDDLMTDLPGSEIAFVDRLVDGFLPASARLAGAQNEGAAVDPAADYRLESIRAPVLIVHARDDGLNPFAVSEELSRQIPGARHVALDRGGHLLLGHHADLREQVRLFLDRSRSR
jgi:pimeloyl-ACP methyl ester carboxylesterase